MDTVGQGESGPDGETSMETYTLPYAKQVTSEKHRVQPSVPGQPRGLGGEGRWGGDSGGRGQGCTRD